jgi:hypothetical protein
MQYPRLGLHGALFALLGCTDCDGAARSLPVADSPEARPVSTGSALPAPAASVSQTPAGVVEKREVYTTHGGKCTVEVTYPAVTGLGDPTGEAKANQRLKERFFEGIAEECRTGRDARAARTSGRCADLPPEGTTEVVVGYELGVFREDLLSVRYQQTHCSNPSLHPNDVRDGLTMDLKHGIVYSLEDLFRPGSGWENVLLSLVKRDLKQKQPDVTVNRLESRSYFLKDRALVLMNVVPARAMSALLVHIPLEDVRSILREDGPANKILQSP